jgi:polysaccharide pyruvyl transferase WcaK-like protein
MCKIILLGVSLDTGNMGVSALAASLIKIIHRVRPDANITFFIGNRSSDPQILESPDGRIQINILNYRRSPKEDLVKNLLWIFLLACLQKVIPFKTVKYFLIESSNILNILHKADFIGDIHGGDSFSDIYGFGRFIMGVLPDIIILLLGKKLVFLPQTYGPYKSFLSKQISRYILRRATHIISRDREGVERVVEMIGAENRDIVHFCPDVAFALDSVSLETIDIEPPITDSHRPFIGLNVNGLLYNGGYTRNNMFQLNYDYKTFINTLVKRFLNDTNAHILLIPHTFLHDDDVESDPYACREIIQNTENAHRYRIHMVMGEHNPFVIKGFIGVCDFFIGSRLHACIAALSQGIPTVGVAYSWKFSGVFESVGVGDTVCDARSVDMKTCIKRIFMHFQNREYLSKLLFKNTEEAKIKIFQTFQKILNVDVVC